MITIKLGEKRTALFGSWYRTAEVGDKKFHVGVERGKKKRIAFKPRGPGAYGYEWHGFVRDERGRDIWSGRVGKSLGTRGLLRAAGLLTGPDQETQPAAATSARS